MIREDRSKKKFLATVILFVLITGIPSTAKEREPLTLKHEAAEWTIYSGLCGGALLLEKSDPFFDRPLIGGSHGESYKEEERVPSSWLICAGGGLLTFVALAPNEEGYFSRVTYDNFKGLFEALSYSTFITALSKDIFGRKRPSYDNFPEDEKEKDGRKSFISGHSSTSFCLATYGSLYVAEHVGGNDAAGVAFKSATAAALYSTATYVAWSRVKDRRHHRSDVIAGGATGFAAALAAYAHQNGYLSRIFRSNVGISISPSSDCNELALSLSF